MNKFEKAEIDGRERWLSTVSGKCEDIFFTSDKYCRVDGYMTGKTSSTAVFEIKNRDISANKYEQIMMEKTKYDALTELKKKCGEDLALYITIFNDYIYVWDIDKITPPEWTTFKCTKTTAENYREIVVDKTVTFLKKDEAIWKKKIS